MGSSLEWGLTLELARDRVPNLTIIGFSINNNENKDGIWIGIASAVSTTLQANYLGKPLK